MKALRPHRHHWDGPHGEKWRGGIVESIDGPRAVLCVLAEAGMPYRYRGPSAEVSLRQPICVLVDGPWPYRILDVRPSHWASSDDARRAAAGEPGLYGVILRAITGESDVLWEQSEPRSTDATVPSL